MKTWPSICTAPPSHLPSAPAGAGSVRGRSLGAPPPPPVRQRFRRSPPSGHGRRLRGSGCVHTSGAGLGRTFSLKDASRLPWLQVVLASVPSRAPSSPTPLFSPSGTTKSTWDPGSWPPPRFVSCPLAESGRLPHSRAPVPRLPPLSDRLSAWVICSCSRVRCGSGQSRALHGSTLFCVVSLPVFDTSPSRPCTRAPRSAVRSARRSGNSRAEPSAARWPCDSLPSSHVTGCKAPALLRDFGVLSDSG